MSDISVREENNSFLAGSENSPSTIFDTISYGLLLFGLFLMPFFFFPFLGISLSVSKAILITFISLASLLSWLVARLKEGTFKIPKSYIFFTATAFTFISLISAIFSPSFGLSFSGFIYDLGTVASFIILLVLMYLSTQLFNRPARVIYMYVVLLISFLIVSIITIQQIIFSSVGSFSFGILNNSNGNLMGSWYDLAIYFGLAVLLGLLVLDILKVNGRIAGITYVSIFLSLFILVTIDFTFVWYVLSIVSLALLVFNLSRSDSSRIRVDIPFPSLLVLIIAFIFIVTGPPISQTIGNYLGFSFLEVRPSLDVTKQIAVDTIKTEPFFGAGPNRFTNQWLLNKPDGINDTLFWNADFKFGFSFISTLLITTGLVGGILVLILLLLILFYSLKNLFISGDRLSNFLIFSSVTGALYLWTAMLFYTTSYVLVALAFVFTGIFISIQVSAGIIPSLRFFKPEESRSSFAVIMVLIILLLGSVLGSYKLLQRTLAIITFEKAVTKLSGGVPDIDLAEQLIHRAIALHRSDLFYRTLSQINTAQVVRSTNLRGFGTDEEALAVFQTEMGQAIAAAEEAVKYDNTNYENWLARARVYGAIVPLNMQGSYDLSKESYNNARARNPKNPEILLERARLELARGNEVEARRFISESVAVKSNYTQAIYLLSQLNVASGKTKDAISNLEKATFISPNDAGLYFQLGLLEYNSKNFDKAIRALKRATTLIPNYSNARYFLGLSYYEVGEKEFAINEFEYLLKSNQDNNEVILILSNLKENLDPFNNIVPPAQPPEERENPPINESVEGGNLSL